jgi:carboxyl-terminal processing protease
MLHQIAADVKKHYYDPKFHGLDWNAIVEKAKERIDRADTLNKAFSEVAAALDALNDSHTFFLPPSRPFRHDFGWQIQTIGDRCYVIRVRPDSDPEAKGVRPGDEVLSLNGFLPSRDNLWRMQYVFNILRPQAELRATLRAPAGSQRQVEIVAKMVQRKRITDLTGEGAAQDIWDLIREGQNERNLTRARHIDMGDQLMILEFPQFSFSESEVDAMIGDARKHKALILDLRGNPGGSVETLEYLVSGVFEEEVKIGDQVGRVKGMNKPMIAKAHGHNHFTGKLVVLVDGDSASAAELFARVVQIEKRGLVLGDHTSGSVMESERYSYKEGVDTVVFFGASITVADLVMTDGKSLEHSGVSPDQIVLPTPADLASGLDPVLARSAETFGVKLSPEEAGKMFPYEWPDR